MTPRTVEVIIERLEYHRSRGDADGLAFWTEIAETNLNIIRTTLGLEALSHVS